MACFKKTTNIQELKRRQVELRRKEGLLCIPSSLSSLIRPESESRAHPLVGTLAFHPSERETLHPGLFVPAHYTCGYSPRQVERSEWEKHILKQTISSSGAFSCQLLNPQVQGSPRRVGPSASLSRTNSPFEWHRQKEAAGAPRRLTLSEICLPLEGSLVWGRSQVFARPPQMENQSPGAKRQ